MRGRSLIPWVSVHEPWALATVRSILLSLPGASAARPSESDCDFDCDFCFGFATWTVLWRLTHPSLLLPEQARLQGFEVEPGFQLVAVGAATPCRDWLELCGGLSLASEVPEAPCPGSRASGAPREADDQG